MLGHFAETKRSRSVSRGWDQVRIRTVDATDSCQVKRQARDSHCVLWHPQRWPGRPPKADDSSAIIHSVAQRLDALSASQRFRRSTENYTGEAGARTRACANSRASRRDTRGHGSDVFLQRSGTMTSVHLLLAPEPSRRAKTGHIV